MKDNYLKRLKDHPGVGVAGFLTILGFLSACGNKSLDWMGVLIVGGSFSLLMWSIVLISNIKKGK